MLNAKYRKSYIYGINEPLELPQTYYVRYQKVGIYHNYYVSAFFIQQYLKQRLFFFKQNLKVLIEHTSANLDYKNLHLGNLLSATIGKTYALVMRHNGHCVNQQYYVNDDNKVIRNLFKLFKTKGYSYDEVYGRKNEADTEQFANLKFDENAYTVWRKQYTAYQLSRIKKLLHDWGFSYDCFTYESDYITHNLPSLESQSNLQYYTVGNKKVYLTDRHGIKLYAYADTVMLLVRYNSDYDKVYCFLGKEQKLYSECLQNIAAKLLKVSKLQLAKKVEFKTVKLLKYNSKKISKRGGTTLILSQLDAVYRDFAKYYLLYKYYQKQLVLIEYMRLVICKHVFENLHFSETKLTNFMKFVNIIDYCENLVSMQKYILNLSRIINELLNLYSSEIYTMKQSDYLKLTKLHKFIKFTFSIFG